MVERKEQGPDCGDGGESGYQKRVQVYWVQLHVRERSAHNPSPCSSTTRLMPNTIFALLHSLPSSPFRCTPLPLVRIPDRYAYQELSLTSSASSSSCEGESHRLRAIMAYRCALRLCPSSGHVWKQLHLVALPTPAANAPGIGGAERQHHRHHDEDDELGAVAPRHRITQLYFLARA